MLRVLRGTVAVRVVPRRGRTLVAAGAGPALGRLLSGTRTVRPRRSVRTLRRLPVGRPHRRGGRPVLRSGLSRLPRPPRLTAGRLPRRALPGLLPRRLVRRTGLRPRRGGTLIRLAPPVAGALRGLPRRPPVRRVRALRCAVRPGARVLRRRRDAPAGLLRAGAGPPDVPGRGLRLPVRPARRLLARRLPTVSASALWGPRGTLGRLGGLGLIGRGVGHVLQGSVVSRRLALSPYPQISLAAQPRPATADAVQSQNLTEREPRSWPPL